mmetsp:Transcript_15960/g.54476  ORF Transcript_15960/g.54476 Transcript_15960/m.54476 type:complete len:321 (+) Transcript_15960:324-1286(+)
MQRHEENRRVRVGPEDVEAVGPPVQRVRIEADAPERLRKGVGGAAALDGYDAAAAPSRVALGVELRARKRLRRRPKRRRARRAPELDGIGGFAALGRAHADDGARLATGRPVDDVDALRDLERPGRTLPGPLRGDVVADGEAVVVAAAREATLRIRAAQELAGDARADAHGLEFAAVDVLHLAAAAKTHRVEVERRDLLAGKVVSGGVAQLVLLEHPPRGAGRAPPLVVFVGRRARERVAVAAGLFLAEVAAVGAVLREGHHVPEAKAGVAAPLRVAGDDRGGALGAADPGADGQSHAVATGHVDVQDVAHYVQRIGQLV